MIAFCFLLASLAFAQDADRVPRLLDQLKSDDASERESASRELVKIGPGVLPRLLEAMKGDDIELRDRAKAILKAIEIGRKVAGIERPARTVTAELEGAPLAEIARALEEQIGTKVDAGGVSPDLRFTFRAKDQPLLSALDALCGGAKDLQYDWEPGGALRLSTGKWSRFPTSYSGSYCVRVKSLQVIRGTDFDKHQAGLQMVVEADHDRALKPLSAPELKLEEIVDDQGTVLEPADARKAWRGLVDQRPGVQAGRTFQYANLSPKATRLARMRVSASFTFPTQTEEVVIPSPARGSTQELGRYKLLITSASTESVASTTAFHLSFSPLVGSVADLKQDLAARFDTASVFLVDDAGREHAAVLQAPDRFAAFDPVDPSKVDYVFTIAKKVQRSERKALKLQFHKETFVKTLTLEFKDLALP